MEQRDRLPVVLRPDARSNRARVTTLSGALGQRVAYGCGLRSPNQAEPATEKPQPTWTLPPG